MDPFAAPAVVSLDDLFTEVSAFDSAVASFQQSDFENAWNDKKDLSAEEDSLFPNGMDKIDMDALFPEAPTAAAPVIDDEAHSMDPFLSAAATLDFGLGDIAGGVNEDAEVSAANAVADDHSYVNTLPARDATPVVDDDVIMYNSESDDDDNESTGDGQNSEEAPEPKEIEPATNPVRNQRKTRRGKKKPKANAWTAQKKRLLQKVAEEEEKVKLYEQKPFTNPELERCRVNAINAKMNRERKKKEREEMAKEMNKLKTENQRLKKQEAAMRSRASDAERELQRLRSLLRSNNLNDILEKARCGRKHTTDRARESCAVCSLGN